ERAAVNELRESLLPLATILTPNLPEAGVLLGSSPVDNLKDMRRVAERLRRLLNDTGERWVFLKGGHLPGNSTIDVLHDGDRLIELPGERIDTPNTHGTGCTLSAALAALLPQTGSVPEAARLAKAYLVAAIARSGELQVGSGHGPVQHFHAWWPAPNSSKYAIVGNARFPAIYAGFSRKALLSASVSCVEAMKVTALSEVEQARFNMIEQQIRPWEVLNQQVLQALFEVQRERYVPAPMQGLAFSDVELPLIINAV